MDLGHACIDDVLWSRLKENDHATNLFVTDHRDHEQTHIGTDVSA